MLQSRAGCDIKRPSPCLQKSTNHVPASRTGRLTRFICCFTRTAVRLALCRLDFVCREYCFGKDGVHVPKTRCIDIGIGRDIVDGITNSFISVYIDEISNCWMSIDLGDLMEVNRIALWLYPNAISLQESQLQELSIRVGTHSVKKLDDAKAVEKNALVWNQIINVWDVFQHGYLDVLLEPSVRGRWATLQSKYITGKVSLTGSSILLTCTLCTILV